MVDARCWSLDCGGDPAIKTKEVARYWHVKSTERYLLQKSPCVGTCTCGGVHGTGCQHLKIAGKRLFCQWLPVNHATMMTGRNQKGRRYDRTQAVRLLGFVVVVDALSVWEVPQACRFCCCKCSESSRVPGATAALVLQLRGNGTGGRGGRGS